MHTITQPTVALSVIMRTQGIYRPQSHVVHFLFILYQNPEIFEFWHAVFKRLGCDSRDKRHGRLGLLYFLNDYSLSCEDHPSNRSSILKCTSRDLAWIYDAWFHEVFILPGHCIISNPPTAGKKFLHDSWTVNSCIAGYWCSWYEKCLEVHIIKEIQKVRCNMYRSHCYELCDSSRHNYNMISYLDGAIIQIGSSPRHWNHGPGKLGCVRT